MRLLFFVLVLIIVGVASANDNFHDTATIVLNESSNARIYLKPANTQVNFGLGFFMLQVLEDPHRSGQVTICEESSVNCVSMRPISKPLAKTIREFAQSDLSNGHVPILKPDGEFLLVAHKTYVISLSGFRVPPKNITAMPQSLFLYDFTDAKVSYIDVTSYTNNALTSKNTSTLTANRLRTNWDNSILTTNNPIIVPAPRSIIFRSGNYNVPKLFHVYGLNSRLFNIKSLALKRIVQKNNADIIALQCSITYPICKNIIAAPEGYILDIRTDRIFIYANQDAGWFYALETLALLKNYYGNKIPSQIITDYPRFKYRGLMLDVVRHFFSVDDIKNLIDVMAVHKLNTLHLHLADDEGWRLQLQEFPELTDVGAMRSFGRTIGASNLVDGKYDISNYKQQIYANLESNYSGYYTLSQMQGLIDYANARQITIIPELELPGHALALKKSLSQIFFDPTDRSKYYTVQGYTDNILPICKYGNNQQFTKTLNSIVSGVANVFAHQTTLYAINNEVSIAGDEVSPDAFTNYPLCQTGVYKGLLVGQLSHRFFELLSHSLSGYKLSGWQDLVQDNDGTVYSNSIPVLQSGHIWDWLPTHNKPVSGLNLAAKLSKAGYKTVLDVPDYLYFDQRYSESWTEPGLYWAANQTDTFSALSSSLLLPQISDSTNIVGLEGAMWSELVPNSAHLFYMLLPKMSGLSEAAWSNEHSINWQSLAYRLGCGHDNRFLDYLAATYHVRYRGYPNGIKLEVPEGTICN